jgi:hypothetical protein
MQPFATADQLNLASRRRIGGSKTRKPNDRNRERPAIGESNNDFIVRAADVNRSRIAFNCQSIHSMHLRICRDFPLQGERAESTPELENLGCEPTPQAKAKTWPPLYRAGRGRA